MSGDILSTNAGRMSSAPDVVDLLRVLIREDTTTGSPGEREALALLAERAGHMVGAAGEVRVATSGDAFVVVPDAGSGPVLLFACHIDTVPVGDPGRWQHPPHAAVVADGLVHGRGASDMKSGLAAALLAVADGLTAGVRVAFAATTGEEAGCLGAASAAGLLTDVPVGAVVIPESTDNRVALGHRGAYWLTVETRGVAAHGSTPAAGVNAVTALVDAVYQLDRLPVRTHPSLGDESVNVGRFAGGEVHNIVPDRASAAIDHRVVEADVDALTAWWAARVDAVSEDLRLDPVWTDPDDAWVRSLSAPESVSDDAVPYFTDASVLVRFLPPGTPIVVWGPGDPAAVHTVDESVSIVAVHRALELFRAAVARWGDLPAVDPATRPEGTPL
ncbi:M20/M25/M40 family metallo-hydrolase [Microbacterium oryzae]|uniref:M20/M25/M40 family metallo-hydrolase n=1 Tax=Microbacterium oryzae TaxID=743009 RepID=UPI0025B040B6|nr:M20/M25/M40 family metallo-hydrolase [Microbacterium oryzae]MDN3310186.1 M20/M25/M40 family metallo-hydrolase [Microbacterium oryzae]